MELHKMVNFDQNKPLYDPATGAVNEDVAKNMADDFLLGQRINAGADGGTGDNVGGPCQESFNNLIHRRGYDEGVPSHKSNY